MLVGDGGTSSIGVDTWEVLVVTEAAQEGTIDIGSGGIVLATDTIKDVLAVVGGVGTRGVASLEAESSSTHEVVPFDGLDHTSTPGVGEEETTEGVTTLIGTVGVELSSGVGGVNVDEVLLDEASDLDVVGGLHELETGDGTLGDDTGTISGLGAPGDTLTLDVTDEGVWFGWAPEAEIIDAVDDSSLAQRGRALGSAVADVVTELGTTLAAVGISLVWQGSVGKVLRSKRNLSESNRQEAGDDGNSGKDGWHFFVKSRKRNA